jgi:hypothetical protein
LAKDAHVNLKPLPPAPILRVASVGLPVVGLLVLALVATACLPGGGLIPPQQVFVSLHLTGGIAARDQTVVIRGDGSVETSGQLAGQPSAQPTRALAGGAQAANALRDRLVATGVYDVTPGEYLPADPCCDRITYELTLVRNGKSYRYVTMDATDSAPRPVFAALAVVQEAIRSAQ